MKTVTMNLKMKVPQHHHRRKTKRNLGIRSVQIRKEIQAEVGQVDVHEAEEGPGQGLEVDQEVLGDPQEDGVELQADLGIGADQSDRLRGEEVDHVIDLEGAVERPADHVVDRQVVVETKRLIDHAAGLEEEAELLGSLGHVEEAELPNGLDHEGGLVEEAGHQVDKGVNQKKEASRQNVLKADVDLHQNRRSARRHQKRKRKKKKNLLLRRRRRKKKKSQRKRRKRRRKRLKRRRKMTKRTPGRPTNMMKKKKKKGKRKKSKECRLSQNRIQRIVLSSGKSRERLETSHTMKSKICFNRSVNF